MPNYNESGERIRTSGASLIAITAAVIAVAATVWLGWTSTQRVNDLEQALAETRAELASIESATQELQRLQFESTNKLQQAREDVMADIRAERSETLSSIWADLRDIGADVANLDGTLEDTRVWLGDLAHCLVLEALGGRYTYWLASPLGPLFGNQGTSIFEDQMSHCE